jgi:hypothetical protein
MTLCLLGIIGLEARYALFQFSRFRSERLSVFHQFEGSFSQSLSFQTKLLGCD